MARRIARAAVPLPVRRGLVNGTQRLADVASQFGWRRRAKTLCGAFVSRGDLVFDVGANVGNRVRIFRSLGARVIAIEPQPSCIASLRSDWGGDADVVIVPSGVAAEEGTLPLRIASEATLSSMSDAWIDSVKESGRFQDQRWDTVLDVPVTTLDHLVERFGMPAFTKVDVEGYEVSVLSGLTCPLPALSFEFAVERLDDALRCLDLLTALSDYEFAISLGETFALGPWSTAGDVREQLARASDDLMWGDIYARRALAHAGRRVNSPESSRTR